MINLQSPIYDVKFMDIVGKNPIEISDYELDYVKTISHAMYSDLVSKQFYALQYKSAVDKVKNMTDRELLEELYLRGFKK